MGNPNATLTEIERQQKYLSRLPDNFQFGLFDYKVALESQRKSAYKTTAAAAREIVDNAIEAGAKSADIIFRRSDSGHRLVTAVAFIDDGSGMLPKMIRYALCWGGGTHYDDPGHIGRFGFGLPNSSINQTRIVKVYSRTSSDQPILMSSLDIDQFVDAGVASVPAAVEANLPDFVAKHLDRAGRTFDQGTVVVWESPDRLTYKRPARLKEHMVDDFAVVYRYYLLNPDSPLSLTVEGVKVEPIDPLFLQPGGRYYEEPSDDVEAAKGGGARKVGEWFIPVKYSEDAQTGERHLRRVESESEIVEGDPTTLAAGTIHVRLSRLPIGFAKEDREEKKKRSDAYRRLQIRKTRRGMSFVRANREVDTVDVFPKSPQDEAQGMGTWPLLQSYAYHWGFEVKFNPGLDDVFGITNDKQGVRPIEDIWRVFAEMDIDAVAMHENSWQSSKRKELRNQTADETVESQDPDTPRPAEASMRDAAAASSDQPAIPDHHKESAQEKLDSEIRNRARNLGESLGEARQGVERSLKNRRYRIEYFDSQHGPFYEPEWVGGTVVVRINRGHPFYEVLYRDLLDLPGGHRAKEAVDVLLLTMGRSELTVNDPDMTEWYRAQRTRKWSTSLEDALRSLRVRMAEVEDEEATIQSAAD